MGEFVIKGFEGNLEKVKKLIENFKLEIQIFWKISAQSPPAKLRTPTPKNEHSNPE